MPKGKKTCPKCNIETGARTLKCPCGHEWIKKEKKIKVKSPTEILPLSSISKEEIKGTKTGFALIMIPGIGGTGGKGEDQPSLCPIKLKGKDHIVDWLKQMSAYTFPYCGRQTRYARAAIKYMVIEFIPMYIKSEESAAIRNPDYDYCIEYIDTHMEPYLEEVKQGYK